MPRTRTVLERLHIRDDVSVVEALDHLRWWPTLSVLLGPVLGVLAYAWSASAESLETPARLMLGIFVLAAWFWLTGAIPPFATGVLVIGLGALFVGLPGDFAPEGSVGLNIEGWVSFVEPGVAPVVILMLGGFVMSRAAHRHGLDRGLARIVLRPLADRPGRLIAGVMGTTAVFSMWVSNTATAAMMISVVAPLVVRLPEKSGLRRSLLLAVPIAANIGGMGTPIGTPPNAIAFGALRAQGLNINFMTWVLIGVPLVAIMLALAWLLLRATNRWEPEDVAELKGGFDSDDPWVAPESFIARAICASTFIVTVLLWMTSAFSGVPIGAVALLPIVVFTATRVIDRRDINAIDWDILLLVSGGLALGMGMDRTGLAAWMVGVVPIDGMSAMLLIPTLGVVSIVMATFMSNTAAANLVLPIALGLVVSLGPDSGVGLVPAAMTIALCASLAMSLPVSTPPNAIAFAAGGLRTKDFALAGITLGAIGLVIISLTAIFVLPLLG